MLQKKIIIPLATLVLVGGTLFVTPSAYAQTQTQTVEKDTFFSGLVQFISDKLGVDKAKVQSAVDEYAQQHKGEMKFHHVMNQDEMKKKNEQRLDALVSAGKITADQKTAILKKLDEVHAKYNPESMKDKSPEEMKSQMDAMQAELKAWAKDQGIDESYVMSFGGRGGKMMRGHGMGRPQQAQSATPTPTTAQ